MTTQADDMARLLTVSSGYICEEALRAMPTGALLHVLATSQDRTTLTFAAEVVGGLPTEIAEPALLPLLDHVSPVVREGAIIGLDSHTTDRVWAKFLAMAESDPSPGIRSILAYRVQERTEQYPGMELLLAVESTCGGGDR